MIDKTNDLLIRLLNDSDATNNASVSFLTPENGFSPSTDHEINLFLFEVKENRDLRDCKPLWDSKTSNIRRPPMRVGCSYLVTTWSKVDSAEEKIKEEHRLLYEAFRWLNKFPVIPEKYLIGIPEFENKTYPPPMMVTHMNGDRSTGEFWQALGIPPRPAFYLTVTIEMDLNDPEPEKVHLVKKNKINLESTKNIVVGLVRSRNYSQGMIAGAEVELLDVNIKKETDVNGYFLLSGLGAGTYKVKISGQGFVTAEKSITVPATSDALVFELTPSTT